MYSVHASSSQLLKSFEVEVTCRCQVKSSRMWSSRRWSTWGHFSLKSGHVSHGFCTAATRRSNCVWYCMHQVCTVFWTIVRSLPAFISTCHALSENIELCDLPFHELKWTHWRVLVTFDLKTLENWSELHITRATWQPKIYINSASQTISVA